MILLLTLACLPDTHTVELPVYDPQRACWNPTVAVTFDAKYWREWYPAKDEECLIAPNYYYTADHLCVLYAGCPDDPPLITDDPAWDISRETGLACLAYEDTPHPDCDPPITEWP